MTRVSLATLLLAASTLACASPQLIAHRGGTGDAPENTLPAIELALKNRADAVWVTVQLSKDGRWRANRLCSASARRAPAW